MIQTPDGRVTAFLFPRSAALSKDAARSYKGKLEL